MQEGKDDQRDTENSADDNEESLLEPDIKLEVDDSDHIDHTDHREHIDQSDRFLGNSGSKEFARYSDKVNDFTTYRCHMCEKVAHFYEFRNHLKFSHKMKVGGYKQQFGKFQVKG